MSVNSRKIQFRYVSSVLSFILLWMCGIAVLSHTDSCDDFLGVHTGVTHLSLKTPPAGPDQCVACAWNNAASIYLPAVIIPPLEAPHAFVLMRALRVQRTSLPHYTNTSRGPPTAC